MKFLQQLILDIAPALNWVIVISCFGLWGKYYIDYILVDEDHKKKKKIEKKNWKLLGKR